jgi:hypothetical protein
MHETKLPFCLLPSNVTTLSTSPGGIVITVQVADCAPALSRSTIKRIGFIGITAGLEPHETAALSKSNCQIREHFNDRLFWDLRYARFSERGSGVALCFEAKALNRRSQSWTLVAAIFRF